MFKFPPPFLAQTGQIHKVRPGATTGNLDVTLVTAERGCFVWKRAATDALAAELQAELSILARLAPYQPMVPAPVAFAEWNGCLCSLLTCLEGTDLVAALKTADDVGRNQMVSEFGRMLRIVHGWTPDLPVPQDGLGSALQRAADRVRSGSLSGPIEQEGPFQGADPGMVLENVEHWCDPASADVVFAHGDYCLPNVIMRGREAVGVIDWSRGGYADRRMDLAAGVWTLRYNLGAGPHMKRFLQAYGFDGEEGDLLPFEALWLLL